MKKTILYVAHNHPSVRPGGAEAYALEVYHAMRQSDRYAPVLLTKVGPPMSKMSLVHGGTHVGRINADPDQYYFHTDTFDWFYGVQPAKVLLTRHFREFLKAIRPDVVHFQHTLFLGYDMIREVRNTLPGCAIFYTLQEFLPICHRQGQMLQTSDSARCLEPTPLRCHACFPQYSPQDFFLRKSLVQSHFALVDRFFAPSQFLLERYVDWGIPRDRIIFEEYGRNPMTREPEPDSPRARNRFAFFGQFSPYKGIDVLLEAMAILAERHRAAGDAAQPDLRPHLRVHGANLDLQEPAFREKIASLLLKTQDFVTMVGRYDHAQLGKLMARVDWVIVPSIWWENSPLVIQEAFGHRRPVICSNIGGMAEKVADGVNGLHFPAGDAMGLADTIERAMSEVGLWETLRAAIPVLYPMSQHTQVLEAHYESVLRNNEQRRAA